MCVLNTPCHPSYTPPTCIHRTRDHPYIKARTRSSSHHFHFNHQQHQDTAPPPTNHHDQVSPSAGYRCRRHPGLSRQLLRLWAQKWRPLVSIGVIIHVASSMVITWNKAAILCILFACFVVVLRHSSNSILVISWL